MGGQAIERREILRYISLASVAGTFPGFSRWAFACGHGGDGRPQDQVHGYRALFFSQPQFLMVERLAEMIIPADDTPSAKEAGAAEFIDFMVANKVPVSTSYDIRSTEDAIHAGDQAQEQLVSGLAWLNARSKSEFGSKFLDCSAEQQNSLLEELAYKAKYKPATESGREFFHLMRDYTVIGYYTTKIGLESLGYPGLQDTWEKMPSCSHPNDPEHAYLRDRALVNQVAFLKVSR